MSEKIFLEEAKKYNFQIRELQKSSSDTQLLADCFNSWDDPESWPGGFSHGDPFTKESIFEMFEKSAFLGNYGAFSEGKIVGYVNTLEHFAEEDIVYIGLLGVNPESQGKKIGKHLLYQANKRAIELDKNIISLHTWGGNLKAVPLYKKMGYFWAPESSVYMESFLPGILNRKIFRKYFDKFDWYETFQRELTLEPDAEKIADMDTYTYYFEADNNNSLKVVIDARAKKICGFELKTPEEKIGVYCLVKSSIGYVEYGKVPISWTIINESSENKQFTLKITPTKGLIIEDEPDVMYNINPGEQKTIESFLRLEEDIETVKDQKNYFERIKNMVKTVVVYEEYEIDLAIALLPITPLEIQLLPLPHSLLPGEETEISLQLLNKTHEKQKLTLVVLEQENIDFQSQNFSLTLEALKSLYLPLKLKIHKDYNKDQLPINLHLFREDKNNKIKLPDETLIIPIISQFYLKNHNLSGYTKSNDYTIIENNYFSIKVSQERRSAISTILDKRDNKIYNNIYHGLVDLGLPFIGPANEFQRTKPIINIISQEDSISIIQTTASKVKPGIKVERLFTIYAQKDFIKITGRISNESNIIQKDIGLKFFTNSWANLFSHGKAYLPLQRGLLELDDFLNFNYERHLPREPKDWKESWFCIEYDNSKLLGTIWEDQAIKKIEPRLTNFSNFEYFLGDILPGQVKEVSYYLYLTRGSWKDFREIWRKQVKQESSLPANPIMTEMKIIQAFSIITESEIFGKRDSFNIQPLNSNDSLKLSIINNTFRKFKGKLSIELPKGMAFENNENIYTDDNTVLSWDKPYTLQLKIHANEIYCGRIVPIKTTFIFSGDSFDFSFLGQIMNKESKIAIKKEMIDDKELITIENGKIYFEASKDHAGSVTSLKIPEILNKNNLLSSWPNVKPFGFASHWFGGIAPEIFNLNGWEVITNREKFTSEKLEKGLEKGVRFSCELVTEDAYKGLKLEIDYTTQPHSNTLRCTFRIYNTNDAFIPIYANLNAFIAVSEKVTNDIYFKYNNNLKKRTFGSPMTLSKSTNKWVSFEDEETKMALAILGPNNPNLSLVIRDNGELVNTVYSSNYLIISPKSFIEYSMLFILYPLHHDMIDNLLKFQ